MSLLGGYKNINQQTEDYNLTTVNLDPIIKGEMVVCQFYISMADLVMAKSNEHLQNEVKKNLAINIANYMMDNGLIEYTRLDDHNTSTVRFLGRVCVVPKNTVQILRKALDKK